MAYFLLLYDNLPDYLERRGEFRDEHLRLATEAHERGELVMAGALANPADQSVLVFRADDPTTAESFAEADPYVRNGLVTRYRVRPWTVVIGND
jgi:uncharacterized protein YciI